ncbi:adenosylcobinamide-phosphate synthase CbiB [Thiocystis violacea]|uniref:adenosylcobinamide-phosphate synthase CbiB n=1 Tax=Thiocystis violacea TaxID=13725 RepID=UPI00190831DD|nr:adenosylcobinamide-phosphate synthase CbiB [Thiocystis violacea]MBK1720454.1 cobalamin biosynthesis protein CobD [Thiocystis violacea]
MAMTEHLILVLGACLLDAAFGDPVYRWHPIRVIGSWSLACERILFGRGLDGRLGGLLHWLLVVGGALAIWFGIRVALAFMHPWLAFAWDLFIAYSLLCTRGLFEQGWLILRDLGDPPKARRHLGMLVGRDTEPLQADGIVRATIESLSENLTDGVLTPLWALCLLGLPGLILVKAVSTLDSMVGYKNARYHRFGWAGARSDDLVHWLPARLSVPLIALAAALLRQHPILAFRSARRYHAMLPSPNSGWSEAAFAGALRVRLIGPVWRDGRLINDAYMGDADWPADLGAGDLRRALGLILVSSLLALLFGLALTPWGWPPMA